MKSGKRSLLTLAAAMLIIFAVGTPAVAKPANPGPLHSIVCDYSPDIPVQFGWGGTIYGSASITCIPDAPDVSSTVLKLWRYDGNGHYTNVKQVYSNETNTDWVIELALACSPPYTGNYYHTEIINDAFHGNWDHTDANSPGVAWLGC